MPYAIHKHVWRRVAGAIFMHNSSRRTEDLNGDQLAIAGRLGLSNRIDIACSSNLAVGRY